MTVESIDKRVGVAASKPKALGMVRATENIPKLRLRLPPNRTIKNYDFIHSRRPDGNNPDS
jgi:hypothetical protein